MSDIERRYGIAGRAAGEAALQFGAGRKATDAFVCSRIARAVVDALAADDQGAVDTIRVLREAAIYAVGTHSPTEERARWEQAVRAADRIVAGGR